MSVHHYNDLQNAVAAKDARIAELEKACNLALTRMTHHIECGVVRPTKEWAEHGSMNFDNCSCEMSAVRAALAKKQNA